MEREAQRRRARRLRELHREDLPLVVLNAWDAGSARVFEQSGAPAVGTTSAGIAYALGRPDGEALTRAELVDATARIAAVLEVPLTADVESGYGATPAEVEETIGAILDAGAVGVNVEDSVPERGGELRSVAEHVPRLGAVRAAAEAAGVELFLNARCDVFWLGIGEPAERLELAIARARAFVEAGADGVFVPGLTDPDTVAAFTAAVPAPVNLLASRDTPPLERLRQLGVGRLSVGSGPVRAVLDVAGRIALEVLETGNSELMAAGTLTYREANELFS